MLNREEIEKIQIKISPSTLPQTPENAAWGHEPLDYYLRCIIGKNLNADNNEIRSLLSAFSCLGTFLKSYKRGLSEALFSGKIGRWDLSNIPCGKYKLGELGYFYNGLSGKNKNDFGKGTSQYISYMNVYKNLIADEHILENVIVSATEKQNSVKYGDVLFTQSSETLNEVGYTSVWLSKSTPFLNSFCFGFRFYEQEQTDPYFIAHYFRSSTIRKSIMREGQGATRVNLSSERLKDMVILLPPVHIQKEIGKILNHLEQQIEINAHIEIQLSIYKSRLLQQLFI